MHRIKYKISVIVLFFLIGKSYACDIPLGHYQLFIESEWNIEIDLYKNSEFLVTWSAHVAGEPDSEETKSYKGRWVCAGKKAVFTYDTIEATGEYITPERRPPFISPNTKAINFSGDREYSNFLSGYLFWRD